jgi:hypothetical protein
VSAGKRALAQASIVLVLTSPLTYEVLPLFSAGAIADSSRMICLYNSALRRGSRLSWRYGRDRYGKVRLGNLLSLRA